MMRMFANAVVWSLLWSVDFATAKTSADGHETSEAAQRPPPVSTISSPLSDQPSSSSLTVKVTAKENLDGDASERDSNANATFAEGKTCVDGCAHCVVTSGRCLACQVGFVWEERQQRCVFDVNLITRSNRTSSSSGDFDVIRSFPFVTLVLIPFLIAVCWSRRRSSTEADADAAAGGHTPIVILNANINDAMTPPTVPSLAQLPPPPGASPDTVVVMGPTGSFNVGVPEAVPAN